MDLTAAPPRALRLPRFPAGAARGVRGRAGRSRRAGGDAHGLGQVALLPAAGAAARRPHGGRLAARGADAGPGRGARRAWLGRPVALVNAQQDAARERGGARAGPRPASCGCSTWRRSASPSPGFLDRMRDADVGPVRGRRGALRLAVGARLPARLLPAGRRRALARRAAAIVASTATATPRVARDSCARLGAARSGAGGHRASTARTSSSRSPGRAGHEKRRGWSPRRWRGRGALPAIVYAGTRAGSEELASELSRGARRGGGGLPRGPRPRARAPRCSGASWPTRCRVIVRHQRVRDGRGQGRTCARSARERAVARSRPTTRRPAARAATARRRAALLLAENRDKALHVHFIKRDELDPGCRAGWLTGSSPRRTATGRYALDARELAPRPARGRRPPARADRAPHARGRARALAVGARPDRRAGGRRVRRPRRGALPDLDRGGGARALAPVPRDLGVGRGGQLPASGDPAPLRRSARRPSTGGPVLRRLRSRPGAPPLPVPDPVRDRVTSTTRSCRSPRARSRRSAAPPAREILHGGRSKKIAAQLLRRAARLRRRPRTCGARTCSRASTR